MAEHGEPGPLLQAEEDAGAVAGLLRIDQLGEQQLPQLSRLIDGPVWDVRGEGLDVGPGGHTAHHLVMPPTLVRKKANTEN